MGKREERRGGMGEGGRDGESEKIGWMEEGKTGHTAGKKERKSNYKEKEIEEANKGESKKTSKIKW